MANTIKIRRSTTASSVPTTTQLDQGELAVNVYDGKLFFKKVQGATETIVTLQQSASAGITSLNSQTGATQTFAVGTSGTNFAVSSSADTHTFNLPDASATNRGALTSANWTTFNNKLGSLNSQTGATQTFAIGSLSSGGAPYWASASDVHTLHLPNATNAIRGLVSNGTQTFGGRKNLLDGATVGDTVGSSGRLHVWNAGTSPAVYSQQSTTSTGDLFRGVSYGGTNLFCVNTNGQLGLNQASPDAQLHVTSGATTRKGAIVKGIASQTANLLELQNSSGTAMSYARADGSLSVSLAATDTNPPITAIATNSGYTCLSVWQQASTAGGVSQYLAAFYNASSLLGSITHNGSSTAYNTTSDYRLKENLEPLQNALDRANALPVYRFNFIADTSRTVDGCLAHEVAAVVPEAVVGAKDAVDASGAIQPQAVDYSKLVPLLLASIKELSGKVGELQARLDVLEAS